MGKLKFHWLILGLILVLSLTNCIPLGTPRDNQNALETIVALTLTAVAGEAPAPPPKTDTPDAPAPVETETPDIPTFTPPRALQVAYIKNGNIYIWTEGESSVGLTSTGDAVDVSISDDGQVIAYTRRNPTNDFDYEL